MERQGRPKYTLSTPGSAVSLQCLKTYPYLASFGVEAAVTYELRLL